MRIRLVGQSVVLGGVRTVMRGGVICSDMVWHVRRIARSCLSIARCTGLVFLTAATGNGAGAGTGVDENERCENVADARRGETDEERWDDRDKDGRGIQCGDAERERREDADALDEERERGGGEGEGERRGKKVQ
jgi:hypothetical protein